MPGRPPSYWLKKVTGSLKKKHGVDDPKKLAGWIWKEGLKPATKKGILAKEIKRYDPLPMPDPLDFIGVAGQLIRLVPQVDNLIECRVEMPNHLFNEITSIIKRNKYKGIHFERDRIIVRGKERKAMNIFIDRRK